MKARFLFIIFLLILNRISYAQTDTSFWFAVPYASLSHDPPLTADLTLTATDFNNITKITIEQPYNAQIPKMTVYIDPAVSMTKTLSFTQADLLKFSNNMFNNTTNSALLIRSDREITAYYEINRADNNPAMFALKGRNALGRDFWTPFQDQWNNHDWDDYAPPVENNPDDNSPVQGDPAFSQIIIVATENNTKVTIRFNKPAYGYAANVNHIINLDRGQTFMFVPQPLAADNNEPSILKGDRLSGTHITSDKPISVTLGDDSVYKNGPYDYLGDQHIPVRNVQNKPIVGTEYVVMRGQVSDGAGGERVYVLATQANTQVTVTHKNGTVSNYTLVNAGDQLNFTMPLASNDHWAHIDAHGKPVYVLHIAGFGHELGEAILPTIDGCTGSLSVSFTRSKTQDFYLNLMTKADAIDSFYIAIDNNAPVQFLNASNFEQAGTSDWYVLKNASKLIPDGVIPTGKVTRIYNTKNVFHLGYFNGVSSGGGCVYGYFSDYNELEASATVEDQGSVFQVCGIDSIQLKAKGGITYHWSPTEYLDDPNVQNPILRPPYGGFSQVFTVDIEQPCKGFQTLQVWVIVPKSPNAFMAVNQDNGCGPLSIEMKDASSDANEYILDLGDGSPVQVSNIPFKLVHNYGNNTDSVINYHISYTVSNDDGCNDFYSDTIRVYPSINSTFELTGLKDTTVCHSTTVGFRNTSTGNTDTYQWHFGDGSTAIDTLVTHSYSNFTADKITYPAKLIARSPFGCTDTSDFREITVFPYIYSSFTVDSAKVCSPAQLFLDPSISVGVDTFYWSMYDINRSFLDSTFVHLDETPVNLFYNNSVRPEPDTVRFAMHAVNRFGCADSATTKQVIIYPAVKAEFNIDEDEICDSTGVLITNQSGGFNLVYEWNFGNGTSLTGASKDPFTRFFVNQTGHDTTYQIRLLATSDYFCKDTFSLPITVHPFIKALFAVDYPNNCSPLNAQLINKSKGGSLYEWDFGDGATYNTLLPETLNHIYENDTDQDITYHIKLKAQNPFGCSDSVSRSVFLFPRVVAAFGFNSPNEGCNPLTVNFANNSIGQNVDHIWDFGDKTYSTSVNPPPRVYKNSTAKDTTYFVSLTVMNLAGCDSSITKTVTVYSKVTADFAVERVDSCSPFRISVDNYASGGITDFVWQYNNSDSLVLHSFDDPVIPVYHNTGLFPVQYPLILKTRNAHGCEAVKTDTITVFPEMHASFTPGVLAGCQPLPVTFENSSNIISGTSFFWNFDDGRYSNFAVPAAHVFKNLTNTTVRHDILLEATTQYGCFDDTTISVDVFPYIYAKFTIDKPAICSDEPFTIDRNSSAGAINHYIWHFGDNTGDQEKADEDFNYTYHNPGTADLNPVIKLTVTNAQGCDTSWTEHIAVHPEVRAAFSMDKTEVCYPLPVTFTNVSEPVIPLTYSWDFGDGSGNATKNPVHDYKNFSRTADKVFKVSLTTTSEFGCDSTVSQNVTIHPKPMADFNFPEAVDCPPFAVQFTNGSLGSNLVYKWNFDNGITSTDVSPGQTFYNPGSDILQNNVSLIAISQFNCSDTTVKPIQVYPAVDADFEASQWSGCSPMQINLDGTASNENEYYWYIDNKVISNYEDPSYRFSNESTTDRVFNVRFYAVSINGCEADTIKQITVFPKPLAEFLPDPQAQDFNTVNDITRVTMNNQTNNQSIWKYAWDFGDGSHNSESSASFVKNYSIWGDIHNENRIPVSLIATNSNHPQCADTIMHYVIIKPPLPKIEIGPDISGCMPLTVDFSATTKYIYGDSYQWDFGYQDETSENSNPSPMVYDTAGMYIVRVSVRGDGGTSWDYKTIQVYPKPVINFNFDPKYAWLQSQTEPGQPIKFFNNTYNAAIFEWDFDDGSSSNERQPQHEYTEEGIYYITLRAENEYGCWDTLKGKLPAVIEGHGLLEFPNAITIIPGSPADEYYDQNNNSDRRVFRPLNKGVEKYKLEIYNRWGGLIFESDDVNKGWNGFIKGAPAKQDVYVWRVTAVFNNGQPYVAAGDVTVLVLQQ